MLLHRPDDDVLQQQVPDYECPVSVLLATLTWGFAMFSETDIGRFVSMKLAIPYPSYG
ncbi:hypothetical protein ADIAG_01113 [Paeniglutamicibacter gangotriensis Lz1y]|uniref:Uncharacterized protein n=1 Tax=Paeniglutamicibacter gangotriensis Lz1y TaxID=1276920 RepID=M7NKP0_9MICC|nr:hypothetical protein ADIAG_01113 [Paeniglutamicibacter gangotriensis Lz1y]